MVKKSNTTEVYNENHQLIIKTSHPPPKTLPKGNSLFSSSFGDDFSKYRISLNLQKDWMM